MQKNKNKNKIHFGNAIVLNIYLNVYLCNKPVKLYLVDNLVKTLNLQLSD